MKKAVFAFIIFLSIGTVLFGKLHYDQKLQNISVEASESMVSEEASDEEDDSHAESKDNVKSDEDQLDMESLVTPLPKELGKMLITAHAGNTKLSFVSVGSGAITDYHDEGISPWTDTVASELNDYYGDLFDFHVSSYGDMHSLNFIINDHHKEVASLEGDIYLIEPLMGNNLYRVGTDEAIIHLRNLIGEIKERNPHSYIILQPSQPIPNAANLQDHMAEIRLYAKEASIPYINHWQDWPSYNDEELMQYIAEHGYPNEEGHQLWAESILSWFKDE
ncbi:SGNH/GDSL hydrolase family protein [Bacillus sp. H-16]|uniref:SGNH/GDSL hydrolase family protein n=1 Tax=Alteribacter salitolerans TaxID=2912333 RepID=UPI001965CEC0|nr:SGNH/GDSL hydrolase family protein [Alteribacter salitolerans]MBM7095804.1 SGNH/GDSL hydrolase family protein [Alteribacter salitolerans]